MHQALRKYKLNKRYVQYFPQYKMHYSPKNMAQNLHVLWFDGLANCPFKFWVQLIH